MPTGEPARPGRTAISAGAPVEREDDALSRIPGPGSLRWVVLATFLHFASLYYLLATLPPYAQALGGSTFDVGLLMGVFAIASLLVRPFLGAWMDRAGRRPFLLAGALIYALASLGYSSVRSVHGLLAWRVVHAMGLAGFSTAAASLAGDLAPPLRRGTTMGFFGLAQAGALSVGPSAGQVLQRAFGYRGLFAAAAATALAAFGCALPVPEPRSPAPAHAPERPPIRRPAALRAVWVPAMMQFPASITYGTIISFIAVVAREREVETVGTFFALLALSSLTVRLLAGRAYDVWGPTAVLAPALVVLGTASALLALRTEGDAFLIASVLAGLGVGATHTSLLAWVVDRSGAENRAARVASFAASWELGVGGGSIAMGQVAQVAGFSAMFLAAAGLSLLALGGLLRVGRGGVATARGSAATPSEPTAPHLP